MAKNNKLINSIKAVADRNRSANIYTVSEDVTPMVYAGIAIALHRDCGWGYKRINDLFVTSQKLWETLDGDIIDICEKETGISLMNKETAKKNGYL